MLRCSMGFFNAGYEYHLHGMLRKPLRTGLYSGFMHKVAHSPHLSCISICYKKILITSISINSLPELLHLKVSFD
ncbi:MAG TPA: hypothetical protein DIW62_03820 [Raoultella sp.]|nr:hypothetical protein [Raoultella sp.]